MVSGDNKALSMKLLVQVARDREGGFGFKINLNEGDTGSLSTISLYMNKSL